MPATTISNHNLLIEIAQQLRKHIHQHGAAHLLNNLGVYHCVHPQALRSVPLHQPGFVLVVSGSKRVDDGVKEILYAAGELLLFPAGANLHVGNYPSSAGDYLALAVSFTPDILTRFIATYASELNLSQQTPTPIAKAPDELLQSIKQWVDVCMKHNQSTLWHAHRAQEILLLLAQYQLAGNILVQQHASWKQKVSAYIALDISRDWRMDEVAAHFNCSDATLRRRLDSENASFRTLLEEIRLASALGILQESNWTIARVAQAVGYESASRFSERFALRFGLTPHELRHTRQSPSLSEAGVIVSDTGVSH